MWYSEEMIELNNVNEKYRNCLRKCRENKDLSTDIYNILIENRELHQSKKQEDIEKKYLSDNSLRW